MDFLGSNDTSSLADLVFQVSLDPIVISTLAEGRIVAVNAAFCECCEYKSDELLGASGFDLKLWERPAERYKLVGLLQEKSEVKDFEANLKSRSGKIRRALISAKVIKYNGETLLLMTAKDITERFEVEKAYRLLFANNPKPMWIYEIDTLQFLEVNDAAISLYGYSRTEFLSMTIADIRPPEDITALRSALEAFASQDRNLDEISEWRHRKKDGSVFDVEICSHKISWKGKTADFVMAHDISDRQRIKQELESSLQSINTHLDNCPLAVIQWDQHLLLTHWSRQAEVMFGWTADEVINRDFYNWQYIHEDDFDRVITTILAPYTRGETSQIQGINRNYTKDGRVLTCEWFNSAIFDREGNLVSILSMGQDISDRQKTEEALIKNEYLLNATQKIAKVGGWSYKVKTQELSWTEEVYRIYDLPLDYEVNLVGNFEYMTSFYAGGMSEVLKELFQWAIEQGIPYNLESQFITAKGQHLWVRTSAEVIMEDGQVVEVIGNLMDITAQKLSELALRASEENFRKLAEDIPCMLYSYIVYPDGTDAFKYVSPRSWDIFELDPELVMADSRVLWNRIYPEDIPRLKISITEAVVNCGNFFGEFRIFTSNGTKWLEAISYPKTQNNGDTTWEGFVFDISDRKRAEQELQTSLQHINNHFDNSPLAIILWDQDHRIIRWSKQAEVIFGWTEVEIMNIDYLNWQFVYEEDEEIVSREFGALHNSSVIKGVKVNNRNYTKDGRIIDVEWNSSKIYDCNGNLISILTFAQDISDRKLQEKQLQETQIFLNSIIENIPSMIFVKDAKDLRFTLLNEAAEELFSQDRTQVLGRNNYDLLSPEEAEYFINQDHKVLASGQVLDTLEEIMTKTQGLRQLHTRKVPIFDRNGNPQYVLGISEDMTDLKNMEVSLRQKLKYEQMIFRISNRIRRDLDLPLILTNTVSEIRDALQCDRVLIYRFDPDWSGKYVAESVGAEWISLVNESNTGSSVSVDNSIQNDRCYIQALVNISTSTITDTYLQQTQGGQYSFGTTYLSVKDIYEMGFDQCYLDLLDSFQARAYLTTPIYIGDQLWGLLASYQNSGIRDWQEYEVAIAIQVANQLGISVKQAELFAQIKQQSEELKLAKEAAEASTRTKSEFLAMMSHEIRTPMNAVIGMTDILNTTELDGEQQDFVDTIRSGGDALLSIINDILDFSKIEANALELSLEPFCLRSCLESIVSLLSPKAIKKNLTLSTSVDRRVPTTLIGDTNRLRQILLNLVGNSLKFTEQGKVRIEVNLVSKEGSNCKIQFNVIDTGIGIKSDRLERLFQPFEQGDNSITRRYGGTGLGLVISKRLCEKMGGTMWVKTTFGKGSNFSFIINLGLSKVPLDNSSSLGENPAQLNPNLRILLAEDNVVNQKVARTMLKKLGYETEVANNGLEVLEMLNTKTYDLIFMDMQMPEMDGVTATIRIRQDFPPNCQPLVVAMTANAMADSMQECFMAGMDDFMSKPVRKDELMRLIAKLFPYG